MKDYETLKPLMIKRAYDSYIELTSGKIIIDAISSWWCKSLGHHHPELKKALQTQIEKFEHVIFANTTHEIIIQLSQKLVQLMPHLSKVFYAGDGSSAIEIALKISLHIRWLENNKNRKQFLALRNGYHGETLGALSVSDVGLYREPYRNSLMSCQFIEPLYVTGQDDPLWFDASDYWESIQTTLETYTESTTALIIEPIVQGAGGMKIVSRDFIHKLCQWAQQHRIHVIADEIMTGLGRTGKMLASIHANIKPDLICLSKGLTSGWVPFSAVLMTEEIYQYFYDDYENGKSFLHSHTYSGNALGASIALATLNIIERDGLCERAYKLQQIMRDHFLKIAYETNTIKNIRGIGAIIAADLVDLSEARRGYQIYQNAIDLGALLRPLGNTIYWLPPLTIATQTLDQLAEITQHAIMY